MDKSLQPILRDAPGKELKETTGTAYGNVLTPGMLLEMTTGRTIDRHREPETVIFYPLAKRLTTNVGMMILSLQANIEKKLGERRENTYLQARALRERERAPEGPRDKQAARPSSSSKGER